MATQKTITDIRKIVDITPDVNVTVIDKAPILSSRGISENPQKSENRQDSEVTFTLQEIVEGNGPRLQQEKGGENTFEHLARITEMVDPEFTSLSMILKPDGVYDDE